MQVDVLNIQGQQTGRTVELPEEIFGAEPNDHVHLSGGKTIPGCTTPGYT